MTRIRFDGCDLSRAARDLFLGIRAQVPGGVLDVDDAAGDVRCQPLAVRRWHENVGEAVADEYRHRDRRDVESPRLQEREVVVDPAAGAVDGFLGRDLANDLCRLGASQLGAIRFAQLEVPEDGGRIGRDALLYLLVLPLELGRQHRLAGDRPLDLLHVLRVHPAHPFVFLEARGAERCYPDGADPTNDPVGKKRRAGEHMRTAARAAGHTEAVEAELVGERRNVGRLVGHVPAVMAIGPTVAGAIVGHPVDTGPDIDLLDRPAVEPAAGRSVQSEDGEAVGIAPRRIRERPPVGQLEGPEPFSHPGEHTLPGVGGHLDQPLREGLVPDASFTATGSSNP
jgi:hypothetical protein